MAALSASLTSSFIKPTSTVTCERGCNAPRISCCSSSSSSNPQPPKELSRRAALSKLAGTGLALTLSSSVAATSSPPIAQAEQTLYRPEQMQSEKLLKDADKMINEESPPRSGPSRGGVSEEDAGRIAQKGGSGAIPEIQSPGSRLVDEAQSNMAETASSTKQKLSEQVGKAQDTKEQVTDELQNKAQETKENVKGLVGRSQGSSMDKVKELQGKMSKETTEKEGLLGSVKKGLGIR